MNVNEHVRKFGNRPRRVVVQPVEDAEEAVAAAEAHDGVEVVPREQLMREVWKTSFFSSSKTIDVHLGWVRRKLGGDPRAPHLITTLRGRGLRFNTEAPGSPAVRAT